MKKPIIAVDIQTDGRGGGPFTSSHRIIGSKLNKSYNYKILRYNVSIGRKLSVNRIRDLIRQLKIIKPDLVHFSGLQLAGFHIALACKIIGIKNTLLTIRGFTGDMIFYNPIKRVLVKYIFEPLTLLLVCGFYANSHFSNSRKIVRLFKHKSFGVIYNFPPNVTDGLNSNSIRGELEISKRDIIVVSVGRINKEKGYHILCDAILNYNLEKNIKFIIIGSGSYLATMKTRLLNQIKSNQVFILGYRSDVSSIIKECNIFVLPTLHETLGVALLEASVAGLPIIASNTGGIPEIVQDGYNGLLVSPGNVEELVKAINYLNYNTNKRNYFSFNSQDKLLSIFSDESIENKIDNIYRIFLYGNKKNINRV